MCFGHVVETKLSLRVEEPQAAGQKLTFHVATNFRLKIKSNAAGRDWYKSFMKQSDRRDWLQLFRGTQSSSSFQESRILFYF